MSRMRVRHWLVWIALAASIGTSNLVGSEERQEGGAPPESAFGTEKIASRTSGTVSAEPITMDTLDDAHKLAPGDQISFRIVEDEEEALLLAVSDSGKVQFPYIGLFPVEGKSCKRLAREVKAELEKDYYYQATVIIAINRLSQTRGRVYLVGAVQVPGPQEIPSDERFTVSKAIMRAGGFSDFADKKHVKIMRGGGEASRRGETTVVNVADVIEKGKVERDVELEPGDIVYVSTRLFNY